MSLTNIDMDWIVDSGISYYAAPSIPYEQENEEPNEPPASDHVDDSDDVEDGGDHVHDDESHGNEVEQALNDEPVTVEMRRSSRVPKPSTRYHSS
ncbi:hypothetical protein AAC387_Pa02g2490 [Persea americana]